MDDKHSQGIRSSVRRTNYSSVDSGSVHASIFKRSSVHASRKPNRGVFQKVINSHISFATIPFAGIIPEILKSNKGIVSELATNETTREKVKDTILPSLHFPSISEWLGVKEKLAEIAEEMHQQALLTTDPNDDNIDFVKYITEHGSLAPITHFTPDWFKDIVTYITVMFNQITHNSVQFIFKHIYKFVTEIVLYTPEWIFDNSWFPSAVSKFSSLSIGIVVVCTMIEGIKRMCNLSHTPFRETLKKLPFALSVSAATPFLFSHGLKLLNKTTELILNLASDSIGANKTASIFATSLLFEPINILIMLLFVIMTSILCIPMILLHARRWFDLTVLGMLTPLAVSAKLFHSTEEYYSLWLRNLKNLSLVQLVYAVFISILGLLMFATPNPTSFSGIFAKTLLMMGGIYRLAFPPQFIKRFNDNGSGAITMAKQMWDYKNNKVQKGDDTLIGSARVAGKIYRSIFKR